MSARPGSGPVHRLLTSLLQLFSGSCSSLGIVTLQLSQQFHCLEEAFSTYLSSHWRENCFTHPREGRKLLSATSTSTFISSLSIWSREDEGETRLSEFSESQQNVITIYIFFLFLITGDFSEQPSYWFYGSLTSSFQLLFEAWPWRGSYFASNCLSGRINEVDDSQILPCFLKDLSFPTPNILEHMWMEWPRDVVILCVFASATVNHLLRVPSSHEVSPLRSWFLPSLLSPHLGLFSNHHMVSHHWDPFLSFIHSNMFLNACQVLGTC